MPVRPSKPKLCSSQFNTLTLNGESNLPDFTQANNIDSLKASTTESWSHSRATAVSSLPIERFVRKRRSTTDRRQHRHYGDHQTPTDEPDHAQLD